jgi:hypothetical protein
MVWLKKPADATVPLILILYLQNILHAMLYNVFNRTCCAPCDLYICHSLLHIVITIVTYCTCNVLYLFIRQFFAQLPWRRLSRLYLCCLRMLVPNVGGIVQSFSLTSQDRLLTYQVGTIIILSINGTPSKYKQFWLCILQLVY